jgi:hypothetical protein
VAVPVAQCDIRGGCRAYSWQTHLQGGDGAGLGLRRTREMTVGAVGITLAMGARRVVGRCAGVGPVMVFPFRLTAEC